MSTFQVDSWGLVPNNSTAFAFQHIRSLGTRNANCKPIPTNFKWNNLPACAAGFADGTSGLVQPDSLAPGYDGTRYAMDVFLVCTRPDGTITLSLGNKWTCTSFPKTDVDGNGSLTVTSSLNLDPYASDTTPTPSTFIFAATGGIECLWVRFLFTYSMYGRPFTVYTDMGETANEKNLNFFEPQNAIQGFVTYCLGAIFNNSGGVGKRPGVPEFPPTYPVSVLSLIVRPSDVAADRGNPATLTVTTVPKFVDSSRVVWVAADPSLIRVTPSDDTSSATVTSLQSGYTTVVAISVSNPAATAEAKIASSVVHPTAVAITPATYTMPLGSDPLQLMAVFTPDDTFDKSVKWTVSPPDVAVLQDNPGGTTLSFTSGLPATVTVTATANDGGLTASATIQQSIPVSSIEMPRNTIKVAIPAAGSGATTTLSPTIQPDNATDKSLIWSIDKPDVATVTPSTDTSSAVVAFVGATPASVTVSASTNDGGFSTNVSVTQVVAATSVVVSPSAVSADVKDGPIQLTATIVPANADKQLTWTIAPATGVATVSADGLVTVTGEGEATITAAATGASATVPVSVTKASKKLLGLPLTAWYGIGGGIAALLIAVIVAIVVMLRRKPASLK